MAVTPTIDNKQNLGTLSSKKTNQDFNQKKPALSDPNELKSKTNPKDNKVADAAKKKLKIKHKFIPAFKALLK